MAVMFLSDSNDLSPTAVEIRTHPATEAAPLAAAGIVGGDAIGGHGGSTAVRPGRLPASEAAAAIVGRSGESRSDSLRGDGAAAKTSAVLRSAAHLGPLRRGGILAAEAASAETPVTLGCTIWRRGGILAAKTASAETSITLGRAIRLRRGVLAAEPSAAL